MAQVEPTDESWVIEAGKATLPKLAKEANKEHALCEKAYRSALEHAWTAGMALLAARSLVQDAGDHWTPWLEENFTASQSTAYRYMEVANRFPTRGKLPEGTSLRQALKRGDETLDEALGATAAVTCGRCGQQVSAGGKHTCQEGPPVGKPAHPRRAKQHARSVGAIVDWAAKQAPAVESFLGEDFDRRDAQEGLGEDLPEAITELRRYRTVLSRLIRELENRTIHTIGAWPVEENDPDE